MTATSTPPPHRVPGDVWAPDAPGVELEDEDGVRHPLVAGDGGWWHLGRPYLGAYRYVVDGRAVPDPRSPWQPEGISGPSRTVDHDGFAWTDQAWPGAPLGAAVLYEAHIGTFTPEGTFDAAIGRLDHLVDLGVTALEVMPVNEFPGRRGWGYDGVLLFAPHHAYGGPDGFKRLVDACHSRGLAVVLDVVYNHLGPSGNHLGTFGPYFTDRHHTPWGGAVNLDGPGSDEVRRFFCDNAAQWLRDYHVDGLRLDAVHALVDQSATHLLEQLATEVHDLSRAVGRQLWLIAESDLGDPRLVRAREGGGFGLDAQWSDDLHHALHCVLTGESDGYYGDFGSLGDVAAAIDEVFVYAGRHAPNRGRVHGRPVEDLPRDRFVTFLQNHDQIGNRARGERITALTSTDRVAVGAALSLLSPTTPMLFQGEEWGASAPFLYFTDHEEPELAEAVRQGRRSEFAAFGWAPEDVPDPQAPETFERSRLDWDELAEGDHAKLLDWYRTLLDLRRHWPDLVMAGPWATATTVDEAAATIVVHRGRLVVAANLGTEAAGVDVGGADRVVLASWLAHTEADDEANDEAIELAPGSVVVLGPPATAPKGQ